MDEFDSKINKMKRDIEMIKNEINGIQKKNKENKGYLKKSINSLSIYKTNNDNDNNNRNDSNKIHHHNSQNYNTHISNHLRKRSNDNAMSVTVNDSKEQQRQLRSKINNSLNQFNQEEDDILEEIRSLFKSKLSNEELLSQIISNKQKEDLAAMISQQFNLGKCDIKKSFAYVTRFMNKTDQTEQMYQEEINLYHNLCEELLKRSKDKINKEHLQSYLNKINSIENKIRKYN